MIKVPLQYPVGQVVKGPCCMQGQTSHSDNLPKNGTLLDLERDSTQEEGHQNCTFIKDDLEILLGKLQ